MMLEVFSVYDKAVGAFLPPFFSRSRGEAIRSFMEACSNAEHQFNKHRADYTLYVFGAWNDNSGSFEVGEPMRLISALEIEGPDQRPERVLGDVDKRPM